MGVTPGVIFSPHSARAVTGIRRSRTKIF